MRWILVVVLAGCSSHGATGPSWPKLHEAEKDGGESIAPRTTHGGSVAAVEKSGGDDDQPAPKPAAATTAPTTDKPATGTAPTLMQTDETPVTTEDIIIEIDD